MYLMSELIEILNARMSGSLQIVIVRADSMLTTTMNINGGQIQTERIVTAEQETTQPMRNGRIDLLHWLTH